MSARWIEVARVEGDAVQVRCFEDEKTALVHSKDYPAALYVTLLQERVIKAIKPGRVRIRLWVLLVVKRQ